MDLLRQDTAVWRPLPGPQLIAYHSEADVVGFGGAAGGGKTDLAIGKALTQHERSIIYRRVSTELLAIEDRMVSLLGSSDGYNSQKKVWRLPGRQVEFGSCPNIGDETGYQGRPHDLVVFDEASNFAESQVRFLLGWLRTTVVGQRCQALMTFNPPTTVEGRWIVSYFAPWIDPNYHGIRATPGELRWFAVVDGKEMEVASPEPFTVGKERITPTSRTFIPSRISDNPYLMGTGYMDTLQALPEPLRSQMLYGDFSAGLRDDIWQVLPSAWVDAAMARWKPMDRKPEMLTVGVDVARGGADKTTIARKHEGLWFDEPIVHPGRDTPDGPTVAGQVIAAVRNRAVVNVDVIGVGSSAYDFLRQAKQDVYGVNVANSPTETDKTGLMTFSNLRSQLIWQFREMLDPQYNLAPALPPDEELRRDLCAFTWKLQGRTIYVSSRDEVKAAIGRSPDRAVAYFLAAMETVKRPEVSGTTVKKSYNPLEFYRRR